MHASQISEQVYWIPVADWAMRVIQCGDSEFRWSLRGDWRWDPARRVTATAYLVNTQKPRYRKWHLISFAKTVSLQSGLETNVWHKSLRSWVITRCVVVTAKCVYGIDSGYGWQWHQPQLSCSCEPACRVSATVLLEGPVELGILVLRVCALMGVPLVRRLSIYQT